MWLKVAIDHHRYMAISLFAAMAQLCVILVVLKHNLGNSQVYNHLRVPRKIALAR
jgi:hypothetical protein